MHSEKYPRKVIKLAFNYLCCSVGVIYLPKKMGPLKVFESTTGSCEADDGRLRKYNVGPASRLASDLTLSSSMQYKWCENRSKSMALIHRRVYPSHGMLAEFV